MIIGMSRLSEALSLNLKGLVAANRVGARGLARLIGRYGLSTVLTVMDDVIDRSERDMRKRLRELPDGVFRARTYLDHDGFENRLYEIAVELEKRGDTLVFDFSGSSPQAPGFVNCTRTGLLAGTYAGILPILAYDIEWNSGVLRCIEVKAPPRLIVTAESPAPVSQGPLGSIWLAEIVTIEVMSKLVASHPRYIREAQAAPGGGPDIFNPSGIDQYGDYDGWLLLEQMSTGGGSYVHRDGLDPQGHHCVTACRVPNVEYQELISPFLYLYRKLIPDSGGAGRMRGGISAGSAVTLHNANWSNGLAAGHGFESPNARGFGGGHPGRMNARRFVRDSDLSRRFGRGELPSEVGEVQGTIEELPAKVEQFVIRAGDVLELLPQAGGGWGDPYERAPGDVGRDIAEGLISCEAAAGLYGVKTSETGVVDGAETSARRAAEKERRRKWPVSVPYSGPSEVDLAPVALVGDRMMVVADALGQRYIRCHCGSVLGPAEENWKLHVCASEAGIEALGRPERLHEDLVVRFFACPQCGRQLDVEVSRRDQEPLFDSKLASVPAGLLAGHE
jgi:N-methylhydantoinase B